ncbi:MAG: hypothetical protein ACUZ8H_05250 [Candidatus Anammoxibacter sp.]
MSKEATKSALDMMDEKGISIHDVEGNGADGKVTVSDVERYMAKLESPEKFEDTGEAEQGADDGLDSETEESTDQGNESVGSESDKDKSEAPGESEKSESDDRKSESKPESGKRDRKGALICRFKIKDGRKIHEPGDIYKGNNAKYLLKRGAIYRK